jgi:aconitate hydratase
LVPLYLGIKAVFAKSFARIHKANLINSGIIPLVFENPKDYSETNSFDEIEIKDFAGQLKQGNRICAMYKRTGKIIKLFLEVTDREKEILLCGGFINYMKSEE